MILYNPGATLDLSDYGIHVPAMPDRAQRIIDALRHTPELPDESDWLVAINPEPFLREDLLRAHDAVYVDEITAADPSGVVERAFELRHPDGSYNRYTPEKAINSLAKLRDNRVTAATGSYVCMQRALEKGVVFYLGGGSHHAHPGFGHGFCIINDAATAIRKLQHEGVVSRVWIIDVDAHKGDGTAAIFRNDDTVTTLSIHMAHGWPLDGPEIYPNGNRNPSYIPSDIDVPVDSAEEDTYVPKLTAALNRLGTYETPDLAVVLLGADPYIHDALPSASLLRLTSEQMAERDAAIYDFLKAQNLPQAYLMAGGYGQRSWEPYPSFLARLISEKPTH